jgi:precorrin-6B methylase 2
MNRLHSVRWLVVVVGLSCALAGAFAQAPQSGEFQPQVGQAGKDVVWVPTQQDLVDRMLDMAKVTPQDYVIDLGSGDGRTVITAAKRGARALGIEYNPEMVELSIRNAAKEGMSGKASFVKADLFETDFSEATVITMFLLPSINLKLRPKLLDLKPGTRIVSNSFTMEEWAADDTVVLPDNCTTWCTAYLWIIPAKVQGKWRLSDGELTLAQEFQKISGTLQSGGKSTQINGKVTGDRLTFDAAGIEYSGQINGNAISGTRKSGAQTASWQATKQ